MPIEIPQRYQKIYERVCQSFARLGEVLDFEEVDFEERSTVEEIAHRLEQRLFTLVFVGGFNTGKSSMINVLFQREYFKREEEKEDWERSLEILCPEDATPTTSKIHILKWGETPTTRTIGEYIVEQELPNRRLRELHMEIVDTPGTDSTEEMHDEITRSFIPRADMIFFMFSVDQPFTVTEKEFLRLIHENWKREIVFILNKIDTKKCLDGSIDERAIERVLEDIRRKSEEFLGRGFPVYCVSAQMVKEGVYRGDRGLLERSGIFELEDYINRQLQEILHQIKLKSALQTGAAVLRRAGEALRVELNAQEGVLRSVERLGEFVGSFWGISAREEGNFVASHPLFQRFSQLQGHLERQVKKTFHLGQFPSLMFRGASEQLLSSFKSDLRTEMEAFGAKLQEELGHLFGHFEREFQLLLREESLVERLGEVSEVLGALREKLLEFSKRLSQRGLPLEDLGPLTEPLPRAIMVACVGWALGGIAFISGLMSVLGGNVVSGLLGMVFLGGGGIWGGTNWFYFKRMRLQRKLDEVVHALRGEWRGYISTKVQSSFIENFLEDRCRSWRRRLEELQKKGNEVESLHRKFVSLQRELEELSVEERSGSAGEVEG
ncbi:MAG: hypothetical protein D6805_00690 [Planctomycetota bacterium]|nr:MAG: hypothetical protein D6805_00690 [Planctomycetota bacterium]